MAEDHIEKILKAMDLITNERVNRAGYDKTVNCTISDNSHAASGYYTVNDGATNFKAYSADKTFKIGDVVNVVIPQNNYNLKKSIVGKLNTDSNDADSYVSPLSQYFNITGNILSADDKKLVLKLKANNSKLQTTVKLVDSNSSKIAKGYTRMAVEAQFKTLLEEAVDGNYGLLINITTEQITTSKVKNKKYKTYNFAFDSDDMWGNPYYYIGWFKQSLVFDISDISDKEQIVGISCTLYQSQNFKLLNGKQMPQHATEDIFVKNLNISFGYETTKEESIYLYTNDGNHYDLMNTDKNNKKELKLRWNHLDGTTPKAITTIKGFDESLSYNAQTGQYGNIFHKDNPTKYQVNIDWFRYNDDYNKDDGIGENWQKIALKNFPSSKFNLSHVMNKNINAEYFQVRMEILDYDKYISANTSVNNTESSLRDDIAKANEDRVLKLEKWQYYYDLQNSKGNQAYQKQLDEYQKEIDALELDISNKEQELEKIELDKAIYTTTLLSNILEFDNETIVPSTNDVSKKVGLQLTPNNSGVFNNYSSATGRLLDKAKSSTNFTIAANFYPKEGDSADNRYITQIKWYIPSGDNTMINAEKADVNDAAHPTEYNKTIDTTSVKGQKIITLQFASLSVSDISKYPDLLKLQYQIKSKLLQTSNNVIKCEIVRKGYRYSSSVELKFNAGGINGTENSLILEMDNQNGAWINNQTESIKINAHFYDKDNKEITTNIKYKWKFYKSNLTPYSSYYNLSKTETQECVLTKKGEDDKGCIVQCEVTWKSARYTNYIIVPYTTSAKLLGLQGPTLITYTSSGNSVNYDRRPYSFDIGSDIINAYTQYYQSKEWIKITDSKQDYPYIKKTNNSYYLRPKNVFFSDMDYIVHGEFKTDEGTWNTPILVCQNTWDSEILNDWDGATLIDPNNEIGIKTHAGVFGKKDSNNTFSGIVIGEVGKVNNTNTSLIGLAGYFKGIQTFAVDTKKEEITLGDSSNTQLKLSGSDSSLQNAGYKNDQANGIKIYFGGLTTAEKEDHSSITLRNGKKDVVVLSTDPKKYLSITDNDNHTLFKVGTTGTWLQSSNYQLQKIEKGVVTTKGRGMQINLNNGKITAYDLDLNFINDEQQRTFSLSSNNTNAISIGEKNAIPIFSVNWDGQLTSQESTIGNIHFTTTANTKEHAYGQGLFVQELNKKLPDATTTRDFQAGLKPYITVADVHAWAFYCLGKKTTVDWMTSYDQYSDELRFGVRYDGLVYVRNDLVIGRNKDAVKEEVHGIILTSPNYTKYRVTVDDTGKLVVTKVGAVN